MRAIFPLSALLLYVSLPNPVLFLPFWIFISFVPLIIISRSAGGWRRASSIILFIISFALISLVPLDPGNLAWTFPETAVVILLFVVSALIYSIIFILSAHLSDRIGWKRSPCIYGACWLVANIIIGRFFILPPFPIETALAGFSPLIQTAGFFGAHPIGFMIIFTNATIALMFIEKDARSRACTLIALFLLHSANIVYGIAALDHPDNHVTYMKVAIVQPNISAREYVYAEKIGFFDRLVKNRLIMLSSGASEYRPDLVVWPESSGEYIIQNDEKLSSLYQGVASKGHDMMIGTSYYDHSNGKKKNAAFILNKNGDTSEPYFKRRLFPYSETEEYFPGNGEQRLRLTSGIVTRVKICIESMYPTSDETVRSDLLVAISNDASFGNSMIPYIHAASIIFRAIESDKYAIHCSNAGPSIICDNRGRILTYIPYGERAFACADIMIR